MTFEPSKMSGYSSRSVSKASTCWMRSDHCWSHGRGRPSASFQAGQLDRAGAGVAAERHGERLEHDALDVVLGLGLGQAERVDLHAVAEAQVLLVLDAVALAAELLPQHRHRAQLRVLLDEAHAGVDEEGDAPEDAAHELLVDPLAHRVEHRDRVGHRVGDLLDRRRPGLLQVVGADVDRVPLRDVARPCRRPCRRSAASTARAGTRRSRAPGTP